MFSVRAGSEVLQMDWKPRNWNSMWEKQSSCPFGPKDRGAKHGKAYSNLPPSHGHVDYAEIIDLYISVDFYIFLSYHISYLRYICML